MNFDLQPLLENDLLILRPLRAEDFECLFLAASDPLIWEQHPIKDRWLRTGFTPFFEEAVASKSAFLVIDKKSGEVIGTTRFSPVSNLENSISIGWTFLVRKYWGGKYNRSMKMLMINYAFEFVDHILFHVNENNIRSQEAVKKIGGRLITVLENQVLEPRPLSTVIFAISRENFSL